ncbi:MAG: hypothetical protein JJD92_12440 [Frankiaceae bacterium]|nr:hypothetical protein [Frankiaceae bacterium]
MTCQATLLDSGFTARSVEAADGYERLYSEILPSRAVQKALREQLSGLPVDATYVTSNVRLLLPPDVLAAVLTRLESQYVQVVTGRRGAVSVPEVLQPVVDRAVTVLQDLVPGLVASAPRLTPQAVAEFDRQFAIWLADLQVGRLPVALPSVTLTSGAVTQMASVLTSGLSRPEAASLTEPLFSLLRRGDLTGALAMVLPHYLDGRFRAALRAQLDAVSSALYASVPRPANEDLSRRLLLPLGSWWIDLLMAVLTLLLLLLSLRRATVRWREMLTVVVVAVAVGAIAGVFLTSVLPDPLRDASQLVAASPAQRSLLADVDGQLRSGISHTYLSLLALSAVAGMAGALLLRAFAGRGRPAARRSLLTGTATALIATSAAAVLVATGTPVATCNGLQRLCQRGYDEVSYLATHNAMASSSRGFVNADQDPDLEGQLDNGVRALMLDFRYWTTPAELRDFVLSLDPQTHTAWERILTPLASRPGVWLCHNVCQLGADNAIDQLRRVGMWLRQHPDAVVTLIIEDHVSAADVRSTIEKAGLRRLTATPPTRGAPWPTLGRMVAQDRRLVVMTERARPDSGWLRNFYTYAAETPYETKSAQALTCAAGRGHADAGLFLLNNWVSTPAPGRAAASYVNAAGFLQRRIARCMAERGIKPTFVAVDFAQTGQALAVVEGLNS